MIKIVGIDLASIEKRASGFCILKDSFVKTCLLFSNEEIVRETLKSKPKVVAIDAPLSLPKKDTYLRGCDKELLKMKIRFFPLNFGPMKKLTERGIKIKNILENYGLEVIETYPGAAQDILKIPRKDIKKLREGLIKLGIKGIEKKITKDELDAITCALVGKFYLEKNYIAIGDYKEAIMILPKARKNKQ
ncbi:MAG: DUF429 domain-containing protein [Candidatus Aenigmarchaeota archaeon]|nr:DUF429 domain-containing protein [Candidatus Aenigmarchaeota archaeon]MDW8149090.1 DUF429 domain-containing protein [Candidatus Aenigmarchaeota archaeon]